MLRRIISNANVELRRGAENCGKEAKRNDIIDINLGKLYLVSDTLTIIFCFLYD